MIIRLNLLCKRFWPHFWRQLGLESWNHMFGMTTSLHTSTKYEDYIAKWIYAKCCHVSLYPTKPGAREFYQINKTALLVFLVLPCQTNSRLLFLPTISGLSSSVGCLSTRKCGNCLCKWANAWELSSQSKQIRSPSKWGGQLIHISRGLTSSIKKADSMILSQELTDFDRFFSSNQNWFPNSVLINENRQIFRECLENLSFKTILTSEKRLYSNRLWLLKISKKFGSV